MFTKLIQRAGLAVCVVLASCAGRTTRYTMRVQVAEDANARTPVPVDLVFVWDSALAGQLAATPSKDWFATKKAEFRQDDPRGERLTVCEWEWVPGQNVGTINLAVPVALRRWTQGVFVFADYRTPGTHRSRVSPGSEAVLDLGRDDLTLRPVGKTAGQAFEWLDDVCQPPQAGQRASK